MGNGVPQFKAKKSKLIKSRNRSEDFKGKVNRKNWFETEITG
jgi:hypothetical protein